MPPPVAVAIAVVSSKRERERDVRGEGRLRGARAREGAAMLRIIMCTLRGALTGDMQQ